MSLIRAYLFFVPRQRNLWVTDTVERCRKARLAQPANTLPDGGLWLFSLASCLSNQFDLSGKRYAVDRDSTELGADLGT
jgi:hypothetical protein